MKYEMRIRPKIDVVISATKVTICFFVIDSSVLFNREGEAKFLRCSLYYGRAFSIMEPAEFTSIGL